MSQFTFFPAPSDPGYAQVVDDDSPTPNPIGSPVAIPAGTTVDVTAPHGTVDIVDSSVIPNTLYSVTVKSNGTVSQSIYPATIDLRDSDGAYVADYEVQAQEYINITIPDSTVTVNGAAFDNVKATQALNVPVKDDAGTATGSKVGSDWVVVRGPMKFVIAKYSYTSVEWTITADEAGSYTAWADDGASGTWTYSKNGGAFIAATGTVSFVIGDKVIAQRTINTAQGTWAWAH